MAVISIHAKAKNSTRTEISAGKHTLIIDEPPLFGGEDEAPSPVEFLLSSLAGALNAIGQYVAKEMNIDLKSLDIRIDGDCNGDCFFGRSYEERAGFKSIRISVTADMDADKEKQDRWTENVLRRCPVLDNLKAPADIIPEIIFVNGN